MSFEKFNLDPRLMKAIAAMGYEHPTPIQEGAMPVALDGKDVLGTAQTGTGKTAAFGLPALQRLLPGVRGKFRCLILSPTRELAVQIEENLVKYTKHTKLRVAAIYGGVGYEPQISKIKQGTDVIVATPGRLQDLIERGHIRFKTLEIFILDEADRMLDMGFLPEIHKIIAMLPSERQTMMFSATMPSEIAQLAGKLMKNPERIEVNPRQSAAVGITHAVYPVPAHLKSDLLMEIIRETNSHSVLVFTRTKRRADKLGKLMVQKGHSITVMHGDRTQKQRSAALDGFKRGKFNILVATDIVARGLDVESITHVINFDVPAQPEDYIHRIGRTARMQALGDAFTLVSPEEEVQMREIEKHMGHPLPRVALRDFNYSVPAPEKATGLLKPSVNTPTGKTSFKSRRQSIPRKR